MKQAEIRFRHSRAGILTEDAEGYSFVYDEAYLSAPQAEAVSLTLPLRREAYRSPTLFPFFDGLIPEGWLLDVAERNWKIDSRDRMSLLLACCKDCIGAVSVVPLGEGGSAEGESDTAEGERGAAEGEGGVKINEGELPTHSGQPQARESGRDASRREEEK